MNLRIVASASGALLLAACASAPLMADRAPAIDRTYQLQHPPHYPLHAVRVGEQGTAVLVVRLDDRGQVTDARFFKSTGYRDLDVAAKIAVESWRYAPAIKNGKAVASVIRVPVNFHF